MACLLVVLNLSACASQVVPAQAPGITPTIAPQPTSTSLPGTPPLQQVDIKLAEIFFDRGNEYLDQDDLDRAIAEFDKAIQLNPNLTGAYHNRGYAFGMKGDLDRAISDLDKAIQLDPNYALAYSNRWLAYAQIGVRNAGVSAMLKVRTRNNQIGNRKVKHLEVSASELLK